MQIPPSIVACSDPNIFLTTIIDPQTIRFFGSLLFLKIISYQSHTCGLLFAFSKTQA
jgi:hypothetical protein